jgi:hypothetical protein
MDNGILSVTFNKDGSFNLIDSRTGRTFAGQNRLEDQPDIGESYNFKAGGEPILCDNAETTLCETTAYSATFFEDGTFTMQLDEEITGTWSFNYTQFYPNGGYQAIYIAEGTPFEIAVVNWYSDRGLSFFYMQTVDGENYINEIYFAPEAE